MPPSNKLSALYNSGISGGLTRETTQVLYQVDNTNSLPRKA
jgi:hypothetical protein